MTVTYESAGLEGLTGARCDLSIGAFLCRPEPELSSSRLLPKTSL